MSIFRNTADLKLFVDIHKQTDWSTLKPYVDMAENSYIIPLVSLEQYAVLEADMINVANVSKNYDQIFTGKNLALYTLVARSLANYALYEAFPFLNTAVGDIGVMQQSSKEGTSTAASQWRYESRRAAHMNVADSYADKTLTYLELNKDEFTLWSESSSFTINKDLFIADSVKLSKYLGTGESRRAYLSLRSYIRLAEKQYIIPAIGKELFDEIKSQLLTNPSTVSDNNQLLIPMIEEVVAWTAYYDALPFIAIRITGDGIQVVSRNDGVNNRNAANKDEKADARAQAGRFMDAFINTLRQYLNDNADTYLLYKDSRKGCYGSPVYMRKHNRSNSGHFAV